MKDENFSILFFEGESCQKKDGDGLFDVTVGLWDGAETCELFGTYILDYLKDLIMLTMLCCTVMAAFH